MSELATERDAEKARADAAERRLGQARQAVKPLAPAEDPAALRAQVAELTRQLAAAEQKAERYRQGLVRSVEALNSLARVAGRPASLPDAQPVRPPAVSSFLPPQAQILGDEVLVTGEIWNGRETDAFVGLTIELLADNRPVDRAVLSMDAPARTAVAYSQRFRPGVVNGVVYSARVRIN